jgi:capsid portal protein
MIRPEHPFDIRPDLRKAASTKAASVIRPNQLVRKCMDFTANTGIVFSHSIHHQRHHDLSVWPIEK